MESSLKFFERSDFGERIRDVKKTRVLVERLPELSGFAEAAGYRAQPFAELCGIGLRSLQRQCCESFGMNLRQFLKQLQLRKAESLLSSGKLAKEILEETGYKWQSGLSRGFKGANGITVKEWKTSH